MQTPSPGLSPVQNYRFSKFGEVIFSLNRLTRLFYLILLQTRAASSIADWGCGRGDFLLLLSKWNSDVFGVEYNESTASDARARGLHIYSYVEEKDALFKERANSVDILFAFHFLEHVHNPDSFIQSFDLLLAKNGSLIVEVPNLNSVQRRISGIHWNGFDTRNHFYHFTPESLRILLGRNGYVVRKQSTFSLEYGATMFFFSAIRKLTKGEFDLFNYLSSNASVNVWKRLLQVTGLFLLTPIAAFITIFELFLSIFQQGGVIRVIAVRKDGA